MKKKDALNKILIHQKDDAYFVQVVEIREADNVRSI